MTNVFDQFDSPAGGNVFDQFDEPSKRKTPKQMKDAEPPPAPSRSIYDIAKSTISNIPASAGGVVSGLAHAVAHPIETGGTLLDIGAGALQAPFTRGLDTSRESFMYSPKAAKTFEAAKEVLKERYGGLSNIGHTIETDPVGALMDVSPATGLLGRTAEIAKLSRLAVPLSKVAEVTDPIRMAAKTAKGIAKPVYAHAAGMATGSGAEAIKQALKGGDAFTQAMRGHINPEDVVDTARSGLQALKADRGAAYREKLARLKTSGTELDISDIKSAADKWLGEYGITKSPDGTLDFSRSVLSTNSPARREVSTVYRMIHDWGSRPGDTTPFKLDTLKRNLNTALTTQQPSRAMTKSLADAVVKKIAREVPEYRDMTSEYAKASRVLEEITKDLSLGDRQSTNTALRKLMRAMKEDSSLRRDLMGVISKAGGKDLSGAVGGLLMKNPWSERLGPIAHFYGTSAISAYLHNPKLLGLLPLASPRLTGEMSVGLGKIGKGLPYSVPAYQAGYQASRIPGVDQPSPPLIPLSNVGQMRQQ